MKKLFIALMGMLLAYQTAESATIRRFRPSKPKKYAPQPSTPGRKMTVIGVIDGKTILTKWTTRSITSYEITPETQNKLRDIKSGFVAVEGYVVDKSPWSKIISVRKVFWKVKEGSPVNIQGKIVKVTQNNSKVYATFRGRIASNPNFDYEVELVGPAVMTAIIKGFNGRILNISGRILQFDRWNRVLLYAESVR